MQKIQIFYSFILILLLTSCDSFGTKKVKTIIELTPKLTAESTQKILLNSEHGVALDQAVNFSTKTAQNKFYNLTKHNLISKPAFGQNKVFSIDDNGIVSAFSVEDKKILWQQNISHNQYDPNYAGGGIVYSHGKLYITNGSRYLVILDSTKGYEILRKEFSDIIRTKPILLSENKLLVQTISNQVLTYDIANAKTNLWHEAIQDTLSSGFYIDPIITQSKVIVCYSSGTIAALNSKSGEGIWELNIGDIREEGSGDDARISAIPLVHGDYIYVASNIGKTYKINLNNGDIVWNSKTSDVSAMNIIGNNLFIVTNARQAAAIDMDNGQIKWVANLDSVSKNKPRPELFQPPFIVVTPENTIALVILGSSGLVYSFYYQDGVLSDTPMITEGIKNLLYKGYSCCSGGMYLVNRNQIVFLR